MSHRVVISDAKADESDLEIHREALSDVDAEVVSRELRDEEEVREAARESAALIVDTRTPVTEGVFDSDELRVVGRAGIGVDNIAIDAAADAGITVVNAPTYCLDEVATHALSLLLACSRNLPAYDEEVRDGGWDWRVGEPTVRLRNATLGLAGFGRIPRRLATMVQGFGCEIAVHDPYLPDGEIESYNAESVGFEELLERSDLLSIHLPLTDETEGTFDREAFEAMLDHAVLANTARGGIVDEDALAEALEDGEIKGAGLDVMREEPPEDSPLLGRDDVLLSPHAGWYSESAREDLAREVAGDVARVLSGEEPSNPVTDDW
ncbi:C-terminal binding protein [Halalkalicoccus tibetensis]|uniref:C-terminal binding protein n=1 Tax=Halalkalicoccus tibetensis TaxID=175632 RepID=A0ABD5V5Z9_9EURY